MPDALGLIVSERGSDGGSDGGSYLAALTGADSIVVSRGLVLTDEAGLVDSGGGRW